MEDQTAPKVKTQILVISDTHGHDTLSHESTADVAIHCGDLTQGSKLDEFRAAIHLLKQLDAPLKLVIPGNHDFTLDIPTFQAKADEAWRLQQIDPLLIEQECGYYGQVKDLFAEAEAKDSGIQLLSEGTHHFTLQNGASLTVYASPFTPSYGDWGSGDWGFQYPPQQGHNFAINLGVDIVITWPTSRYNGLNTKNWPTGRLYTSIRSSCKS